MLIAMTLVWSFFNLLLFVMVIYAFWRVTKLIGQQLGKAIAILFVVGVFGFKSGTSGSSSSASNNLISPTPVPDFRNAPLLTYTDRPIGNGLSIYVRATYEPDELSLSPVELTASVSGLVAGHEWTPIMGYTNLNRDSTMSYVIQIEHKWKLLNHVMFTNSESYKGVMPKPNKFGWLISE